MKKLILLFIFIAFNSNAASMKMFGSKGNPNDVTRVIEVKMYDNYYKPSSIQVKKGETVKIIVKNLGELVHEYNIATKEMHIKHTTEMAKLIENDILLGDSIDHAKMKEMSKKDPSLGHKHANSVMLEPNKTGEIIWKFSNDIALEMACNIPGHYETGMVGPIIIK